MKTALQATPIFSSFLGVGDLEIDHDRVMNWVNSQEVDAHNRIKLNFGEEELSELYDEMLELFNDIHAGLQLKPIYEQVFERGWVNTSDNQRFNHHINTQEQHLYQYTIHMLRVMLVS